MYPVDHLAAALTALDVNKTLLGGYGHSTATSTGCSSQVSTRHPSVRHPHGRPNSQLLRGRVRGPRRPPQPLDDNDRDEAIEIVEGCIIEPWQEARIDAAAHPRARLAGLDPKLEEICVRAWEHLASKGPGYTESSCHLASEGAWASPLSASYRRVRACLGS